jgi:signal transduction histidine kinase
MGTGSLDDPLRVLLVDDDEEDYILTREYLSDIPNRSFHLEWVRDYDEALDRICERHFDVYLIDYRLGERDGLHLIQDAQQRGCLEPMILLTGQGQMETDLAAMNAGAADYLEKTNLDSVRLERTIRYACLQKRLESELEAKVRERTQELELEIQARRRVEDQLRDADRRKDEFLGMLAHELRNPLMPITNALAILEMSGTPSGPAQKAMAILDRQVRIMVRLIDDLLDVSRITSGKLRLDLQPLSFREVLTSALEVSQLALSKADVTLQLEIPDTLPPLQGDRVRLAQVFTNLLNNAAKFTPSGGQVRIVARVESQASPAWLIVHVQDTGVGISAESIPHLFDLFSQDPENLDRSRGGLGIGLALVRGFVALHGGTVEVFSAGINQGSTFTVRLPLPVNSSA